MSDPWPALDGQPFSRAVALAEGLTDAQLQGPRVRRLHHGGR